VSRNQRFGLLALAAVVAVVAIVIASAGGDDDEAKSSSTPTTREAEKTQPAAKPVVERIQVKGGKPVGGVRKITVTKGDRLRIRVSSPDTSEEVHLHGYDVMKEMAPGKPATFDLPADIEGVFEMELEGPGVQIASIEVRPS
jgi:FtsP/CotA-like multicopper oxidase with cupredoxin domain